MSILKENTKKIENHMSQCHFSLAIHQLRRVFWLFISERGPNTPQKHVQQNKNKYAKFIQKY
jgi:hypothetical protein